MYEVNKVEDTLRPEIKNLDEGTSEYVCQLLNGCVLKRNGSAFTVENTGYPYPDCSTTDLTSWLFIDAFLEEWIESVYGSSQSIDGFLVYYRPKFFKYLIKYYTNNELDLNTLATIYLKLSYINIEKIDGTTFITCIEPEDDSAKEDIDIDIDISSIISEHKDVEDLSSDDEYLDEYSSNEDLSFSVSASLINDAKEYSNNTSKTSRTIERFYPDDNIPFYPTGVDKLDIKFMGYRVSDEVKNTEGFKALYTVLDVILYREISFLGVGLIDSIVSILSESFLRLSEGDSVSYVLDDIFDTDKDKPLTDAERKELKVILYNVNNSLNNHLYKNRDYIKDTNFSSTRDMIGTRFKSQIELYKYTDAEKDKVLDILTESFLRGKDGESSESILRKAESYFKDDEYNLFVSCAMIMKSVFDAFNL